MLRRKERPTVRFGQHRNGSRQQAHYFVTRLTPHAGSAEHHKFRLSHFICRKGVRKSVAAQWHQNIWNLYKPTRLVLASLQCYLSSFLVCLFSVISSLFSFLIDTSFGQYSFLYNQGKSCYCHHNHHVHEGVFPVPWSSK
jgi:hypothetical protein